MSRICSRKRTLIKMTTMVAVSLIGLAATAAPASAKNPSANGFCGAGNMRMAGEAMRDAMMFHTNYHGDEGMFNAVRVSGC